MKAILLVSHGSRYQATVNEISQLAENLKERSGYPIFDYAFLELQAPNIPTGIARCVQAGATEIRVILNFLNAGQHADFDIPNILEVARLQYPHVKFSMSRPLGQYPEIANFFMQIIQE